MPTLKITRISHQRTVNADAPDDDAFARIFNQHTFDLVVETTEKLRIVQVVCDEKNKTNSFVCCGQTCSQNTLMMHLDMF